MGSSNLSCRSGIHSYSHKRKTIRPTSYAAMPIMFTSICFVIMESFLFTGGRSRSSSVGGSEASATEAAESMMRFNHSKCKTVKGHLMSMTAQITFSVRIEMLTVNWNCKNFWMESNTLRPHLAATTMLAKLSSSRMMFAASLAICVPAIPIAKPTSAFFRAGASLVPSPVIATTCLSGKISIFSCTFSMRHFSLSSNTVLAFKPLASVSLSSGEERANTRK
mmetsp:Transcript_96915/g.313231  ORF Transcript_96915/g.313231 Transcript_96915/m.313231 type:complete len:222 (-) Transcript_96915:1502-2167(-)